MRVKKAFRRIFFLLYNVTIMHASKQTNSDGVKVKIKLGGKDLEDNFKT